jgi:hypothetical protein
VIVRIRAAKPEEVEFTLTVTMTLAGWERLAKQLLSENPSWHLARAIRDCVNKANESYRAEEELNL